MEISRTSQEEPEKEAEVAPIYDVNNVALNYIVVIDSGSKGTRAFIYSWETPKSSEDGVRILYEEHWNKKVQPSIDNLVLNYWNDNGNLELYFDHLMYSIYKIIPREQHFRTPIFFHGTAGLRVLKPQLQSNVIDKICTYLQSETDFFLPDCNSHVNIISGETEALYSWVAVNYLKLQAKTEKVDSFGVFALGGGSAQIAFEPSTINVKDQIQNKLLYSLKNLPLSKESSHKADHQLYLDSFVKLGFNHFHQAYLKMLLELNNYKSEFYDPCLPDLFTQNIIIDKSKYKLKGTGDFNKCQSLISQLFSKNINSKSNKVLKDHAPPLSFNNIDTINYIAVTGYWDTVSKLLDLKNSSVKYSYDSLLYETKKICSMDIQKLLSSKYSSLAEKESTNLCFKSNYILELIENGLNKESTEIKNLIINDRMGSDNTKFSWTLGKAYLYAVDEFNRLNNLPRTSFSKNILPGLIQYGSEQDNVGPRPKFELFDNYEDYYLNFNDNNEDEYNNEVNDNYLNDDKAEDSDWSSWWSGGHYFNSTLSIDYDDGSVYDDEMDDSETINPNNISSSNKLFSLFILMILLIFVFKKPVLKVLLYTIKLIKFKIGKLKAKNKRYHCLNNETELDDEYNIEGGIISDNVNNKYNNKYTNTDNVETIPYYCNNKNTNNNNNNNNNNHNKNNNNNNILSNSDGVDDMHLDFTNITRRDIELKTFEGDDDEINTNRDEEYNNEINSNDNDDDENGIDSEVEFSDLDDGWDSDGIERAV